MVYLANLNLSKNELQNAVIQPLATAPANPKEGQIYYNSSDKFIYRFDGTNWGPIGVVYNQGSTTGAVITGLDSTGKVTTTNVTGLTLTGYSPISGGYVTTGMTMQQAIAALDEAVKNAVAGAADAVLGTASDSSAKATVYGARALATEAKTAAGTAQAAADNAMAEAQAKVKSVGAAANKGIEIAGTATEPTIGIKLNAASGNAASLSADGLMVTIPEVTVPEYTIVKLSTATEGYLASYQLQKDNVGVGAVINIPKDYLVKSAEVKTSIGVGDASGLPAGTKYIDFTINTYDSATGSGTTSHIYLNVKELVDTYTAGNGIDISDTNVISVKVVGENGLSVDGSGIKMAVASTSANGAMTSAMVTKLNGIDTGATANTITLNGTANKNPNFYAPTAVGDKDQILVSNGSGAPTWQTAPEKFHKYSAFNADLTATGGAFSWSIPAATHKFTTSDLIVQLYDSNGNQVIADVVINQTNYGVTIIINDTASAGTLASGSYRVVIMG